MQPSERKYIVLCISSFNGYPYSKQNQSLYCLQEVVWRSVLSSSVVCHVILLNSMRLCYSHIQTFAYKYKNLVLIWNAYLLSKYTCILQFNCSLFKMSTSITGSDHNKANKMFCFNYLSAINVIIFIRRDFYF